MVGVLPDVEQRRSSPDIHRTEEQHFVETQARFADELEHAQSVGDIADFILSGKYKISAGSLKEGAGGAEIDYVQVARVIRVMDQYFVRPNKGKLAADKIIIENVQAIIDGVDRFLGERNIGDVNSEAAFKLAIGQIPSLRAKAISNLEDLSKYRDHFVQYLEKMNVLNFVLEDQIPGFVVVTRKGREANVPASASTLTMEIVNLKQVVLNQARNDAEKLLAEENRQAFFLEPQILRSLRKIQ